MSIVQITNHNENIYNITKTQADLFKKKATQYKSKYREKTNIYPLYKTCVKLHATMGVAEEELPDPAHFLRKHTGKPSYTHCIPPKESKVCDNVPRREKVPTLEQLKKDQKLEKSSKNFILTNIKTASKMQVKNPEPKMVVDKTGRSETLKAIMEPVYIKLPKFGKTPKYLERFLLAKEKEYQMKKDASGQKEQPLCRYITRDEREQLLKGLKQNWEELQKQYQGLPILTDTIPKKIRKTKMERDLKQLETDIVLIERHPYIYVYNDNEIL